MSVQQKLTQAYRNSGLTPKEFYDHIIATRKVCRKDDDRLAFKVNVPEYGFDLEWFYYDESANAWLEG